jgi:hypothetical protein
MLSTALLSTGTSRNSSLFVGSLFQEWAGVKMQELAVVVPFGVRVGPVKPEIPFGFAQGRLSPRWRKRGASG